MSISRERVLSALESGGDHSLHTMEVVQALGFSRQEAKKGAPLVRAALESLKSLGLVKELPGSRWKKASPPAVRGRKASRVSEEVAIRRAERERGLDAAAPGGATEPRVPPAAGQGGAGRARGGSRTRSDLAAELPSTRRSPARESGAPVAASVRGSDGTGAGTGSGTSVEPEVRGTKVGWFAMTPRGFGFVAADDGGEIFVSPRGLGHAIHGDRVRVRTTPSIKGLEGDVIEVIARGLQRVAGTLVKQHGRLHIHPGDPRLPAVFIVEGALPLETRMGLEVVAQVTRWPTREGEVPHARVLRTIGPRGTAAVEVEKIRIRDGVAEEFPADVLTEALSFPAVVDAAEVARREDMRDLALLTIDPKDARDHDDAVWAERSSSGYRVVVAIADVSFYVRAGTAIDREALSRGSSIYLPDRAIPMLPPELSSNLASLVPDEDRLMLGVEVHLTKTGAVRSYRFVEATMRSRARVTYEQAARTLGLTEAGEPAPHAEAHKPLLETLLEVSKLLRARRNRRGALGFELPEAKVLLDEAGEPRDVVQQKGDPGVKRAYELIEDLMLLANETVAEHLSKQGLPAIYRVHGKPDAGKIAQFAAVAHALGLPLENEIDPTPKELSQLLSRIAGTPLEGALGYLLLRSMQQATYQVDDIGHFALAARHYLHFTSPIRRYPDLAVHRIVRALARGDVLEAEPMRRALVPQAVQSSRMERRAVQIEREVQAIYRAILMKKHEGEELEGKVSSVAEHGFVVTLDAPFVEIKVPIERVGDDYFELDRLGIALVGSRSGRRIALADRVRVRIDEASIDRREVLATLMSGGSAGGPKAPRRDRGREPRRPGRERGPTRKPGARTGTHPAPKSARNERSEPRRKR